ncbi:MAG: type II toxin-antitoxin system VapC family toxin [Rubrivivax sp.]
MIVVDTSAWIEWLIGSSTGAKVEDRLPDPGAWLVPTIVQLELAKWLTREAGEDRSDQGLAFTQICQVLPLDTETALAAAEACREFKLATADAIVYATSRTKGAVLLTCDSHFAGLPNVILIDKVRPS